MKQYDFAIIGGGLGGLIAAQILSKEGKKVIVLEKNKHFGGVMQGFKRQGVVFDTGAHYVGGLNVGENLYQYFKYLDILDQLKIEKLNDNCFDKICFLESGKCYHFAQGYDNFVEVLSRDFPDNHADILEYVNRIREVVAKYPLYSLVIENGIFMSFEYEHLSTSIGQFLDEVTQNEELKLVLAATNLVYAGDKYSTPYYIHALILNSYIGSSYRFLGGASQIAKLLVEKIVESGNEVRNYSKVVKFNFNEQHSIQSVQLENGEEIKADFFISNMHPAASLHMISEDRLRKVYRQRIIKMANTYSIFSSYIVLKPGSFENISHNIYAYNQNDVWNNEIADDQWPRSFMMLTQSEQEGQTHASGITVISPMRYDMVKEWEGTTFKNRPQSYLDFKLEMQERLLKLLEKQWPSLRDKILAIESNTPLTYEHYTHTPQGSLYGIIRSNAEPLHTQIAPKTKIANLTFVGQNIDIHGVLGVTVGAFMAAGLYVNLEQLIQKVKEA